jgi:integrase
LTSSAVNFCLCFGEKKEKDLTISVLPVSNALMESTARPIFRQRLWLYEAVLSSSEIIHGFDLVLPVPCMAHKVDDQMDVLSLEEIQALINCHYDYENLEVRWAFIFCLYCGLQFCDVKELTFRNVDYSNRLLKFEQNKTKGHSARIL